MAETGSKPPSSGESRISELGTDVQPGSVSSHTQVEAQQKYPEPPPPPPPPAYEDPPAAKEAKHFDALLGQLPYSYGEDEVVLLPRDPFSCWVFWDFAHHTLERAFEHLPYPVSRLRIFVDEEPFREVDCVLEARGWWLYGLIPGRRYSVELLAVGSNGETRRIGPQSNRCLLPPSGPSPVVNDRFIRIPFDVPPRGVLEGRRGDPFRQLVADATQGGAPEVSGGFTPELREELYRLSGGEFIRYLGASELVAEKFDQWGRRLVPMPGAGENIFGDRLGSPSGGGRFSGRWPGSSWSSAASGPTGKPSPSPDSPVLDSGEAGGSDDR